MKKIIIILITIIGFVFSQEFEVDGNLKVQGDIIFSDASTMASASSGIPAGILAPFAGSTAPDGWLLCDGSAISRTTYSSLFAVIAATYGAGDGSTTFTLPDLRGRMALGLDNMGGTSRDIVTAATADTLGAETGEEMHQLTEDEMPNHIHSIADMGGFPGGSTSATYGKNGYHPNYTATQTGNSNQTGGNQPHNNMPPYMALNYLIKY